MHSYLRRIQNCVPTARCLPFSHCRQLRITTQDTSPSVATHRLNHRPASSARPRFSMLTQQLLFQTQHKSPRCYLYNKRLQFFVCKKTFLFSNDKSIRYDTTTRDLSISTHYLDPQKNSRCPETDTSLSWDDFIATTPTFLRVELDLISTLFC